MYREIYLLLLVPLACFFQRAGDSVPPVGGGTPSPLTVTCTPTPDSDLPIGVEVQITATHDPVANPAYFWGALCPNSAARHEQNWNQATITDCPGSAGTQTYTATVTHTTSTFATPATGTATVKWNKPNGADISFGPGISQKNPDLDYCIVTVCPTYNQQKIGACALVCAQEKALFHSTHPSTRGMNLIGIRRWKPSCGVGSTIGYNPNTINGIPGVSLTTWDWQSPCLKDAQVTGDLDVSQIPVGTKLGFIERYYRFKGPNCDPYPTGQTWFYRTEKLVFNLMVVLLPNGRKAAIYSM